MMSELSARLMRGQNYNAPTNACQPNKLIARELGLSVETVKDHVAAVLRSLGVSSRTQAVIAVSQILQRQNGLQHSSAWHAR